MKKYLFIIAILGLIFCVSGCKERFDPAPSITDGEFPFIVEYEMNGETFLIEDSVVCMFDGYNSASNTFGIFGFPSSRKWEEGLKSGNENAFGIWLLDLEENTESVFTEGRINYESRIILQYGSAEYYMDDPDEVLRDEPRIVYYEEYSEPPDHFPIEVQFTALTNQQLEEKFGIKIIRFEFCQPIENTFQ